MTKFRRFASGSKFQPTASQVNAWTDAAIAAQRQPHGSEQRRHGKVIVMLDEDIATGEWGSVTIMTGPKGAETASDSTLRAYNRFADLEADQIAHAEYIVNGWELTAATCPAEGA